MKKIIWKLDYNDSQRKAIFNWRGPGHLMSDQAHSLTSTLFDNVVRWFQTFLSPKSKSHSSYSKKHMNLAHTTNRKNSQSDKWAKSQCLLLFSMRSPYLIVHGTHIVNIVFKFIVHSWFNAYNTQDLQLKSYIILHIGNAKFIKKNRAWFATVRYFIVMFIRYYVFTTIEFCSTSLSAFLFSFNQEIKNFERNFWTPAEFHLKAIYKRYKHHIL